MLCRRSASLTRRTRMSLEMASRSLRKFSACSAFLVTRSSFLILVRPSTREPISAPNSASISLPRGAGVLDGVVQQRGGDGGVVEPHLGEDGGDFEGMGEERGAGGPLLIAMRLHGVDIGPVEQRLVGVGLVALHPLDQLVLAGHGVTPSPSFRRKPELQRAKRRAPFAATKASSSWPGLSGHPRLDFPSRKFWMPGLRPGMTMIS